MWCLLFELEFGALRFFSASRHFLRYKIASNKCHRHEWECLNEASLDGGLKLAIEQISPTKIATNKIYFRTHTNFVRKRKYAQKFRKRQTKFISQKKKIVIFWKLHWTAKFFKNSHRFDCLISDQTNSFYIKMIKTFTAITFPASPRTYIHIWHPRFWSLLNATIIYNKTNE